MTRLCGCMCVCVCVCNVQFGVVHSGYVLPRVLVPNFTTTNAVERSQLNARPQINVSVLVTLDVSSVKLSYSCRQCRTFYETFHV